MNATRIPKAPATIETARLLLRGFVPEDTETMLGFFNDPAMMSFLADGKVPSREFALRRLSLYAGHVNMRGYGNYAVTLKATGQVIGWCGLLWMERAIYSAEEQAPEFSWGIGRDWWGQGLAGEAGRAVLEVSFATLGFSHLLCLVANENKASLGVARKLGGEALRELTYSEQACTLLRFLPAESAL
jgi:RimJ/RimL family protein N-acetyltransferase